MEYYYQYLFVVIIMATSSAAIGIYYLTTQLPTQQQQQQQEQQQRLLDKADDDDEVEYLKRIGTERAEQVTIQAFIKLLNVDEDATLAEAILHFENANENVGLDEFADGGQQMD